jgi:hypothetical protein
VGFPENHVESVLLRASRQEADAAELLAALAGAELLVPVAGPPPAEDPTRLRLPAFEDRGRRYVPVFTSPAQLALSGHGGGHLRLRGRELAAMVDPATGLAVNVGGDLGLPITPEQVRAMGAPPTLAAGQVVQLGEPAEEPARLLEAVAAGLACAPPTGRSCRPATSRRAWWWGWRSTTRPPGGGCWRRSAAPCGSSATGRST